jgi:FO synthase subunit 1
MSPRPPVVTWSPSVTLVPTRSCFNRCGYCSFRDPADPQASRADLLAPELAQRLLDSRPGAAEVLLLSGEVAPGSPHRPTWFAALLGLSRLALRAGRLPHTNAGPLSGREMAALGRLNPSMGLMLEGLGPAYEPLHRHAPSKTLEMRLRQLEQAGRLGIPFTTGLLLGVGETRADQREALELLALLHATWGHIQEVILQPYRPDGAAAQPLAPDKAVPLLELIAEARQILPAEVHLQLPPNLWPRHLLLEAIAAGIDDLGGLDTEDVINPAYPQPGPAALAELLGTAGWELRPRLCVHPRWIPWLPMTLRAAVEAAAQRLPLDG